MPHQAKAVKITPAEAESVTFCADDQVVQPWQAEPYRLWSLLEMLQFSASAFFWCGGALRTIRGDCIAASAICVDGRPAFQLAQDIDEMAREKALRLLEAIEPEFRRIGLVITADTTRELINQINKDERESFEWLRNEADSIERLAIKELRGKCFLYVPHERAKFFPSRDKPSPFGESVADRFPSASFDIEEAARSFALARYTACVFHLMRAVELSLHAWALDLGLTQFSAIQLENWKNILDAAEKKIRALEQQQKSQVKDADLKYYGETLGHYRSFKDAWRNHVSHARERYDEERALSIFNHTKEFMTLLSSRA